MTEPLRGKLKAFLLIGTMFALMAAIACQGERGPAGAPGAPGNPGNPGAAGTDGTDGTDGADGTTQIAGITVVGGSSAEITTVDDVATASFTIIGGGFAKGESISVSAKKGGFDKLLSESTSKRNDSLTVANENGAFELSVDADWGAGVYTILATGDQGNRGATAVLLVDKVDG